MLGSSTNYMRQEDAKAALTKGGAQPGPDLKPQHNGPGVPGTELVAGRPVEGLQERVDASPTRGV